MKRSNQIIQFTKFPSNRLLASLAFILALLRHHNFVRERFYRLISALRRGIHIARLIGLAVSYTSEDILTYLQPSLNPRPLPRTSPRPTSYPYSYRGRQHSNQHSSISSIHYNTQSSSPTTSQSQVPRSLRRILRLASSPDGLVILHNVAGGLARGITREFREQQLQHEQNSPNSQHNSSTNRINENRSSHHLQLLLKILDSPSGQSVLSNVVSTGVREAVTCFLQHQRTTDKQEDISLPQLISESILSDRGRQLVVDVATGVTRTAVPLFLQQQGEQQQEQFMKNSERTDIQVTTVHGVPSSSTLSPVGSPLVKRPLSFSGHSRLSSPITQTAEITPVTKHLVHSIMQAQGRTGLVERLALLAIRDKELVREIVRTVVGEAVRTYLTTKSALQEEGDENGNKVDNESSRQLRNDMKNHNSNDTQVQDNIPKSLWKVLIKSAIIDFKRELIARGSECRQSGWLIF